MIRRGASDEPCRWPAERQIYQLMPSSPIRELPDCQRWQHPVEHLGDDPLTYRFCAAAGF